jgi:hypothetical protein
MVEEQARLDLGDLGPGGEGIQGQVPKVRRVPHRHMHEKVLAARQMEDRQDSRKDRAWFQKSLTCLRLCWRRRTATSAWRLMPMASGATQARASPRTPSVRSRWTRERQLEGANPTAAANSLLVIRALF